MSAAATTEEFSVVQTEGRCKVVRRVKHHNVDAIISVGCRINSKCGLLETRLRLDLLAELQA